MFPRIYGDTPVDYVDWHERTPNVISNLDATAISGARVIQQPSFAWAMHARLHALEGWSCATQSE